MLAALPPAFISCYYAWKFTAPYWLVFEPGVVILARIFGRIELFGAFTFIGVKNLLVS
jgi:hypothetical protein